MSLGRLKWIFLATLVALFVFVEFARYHLLPFLTTWQGRLAMDLVILFGALFFFGFVFDIVHRMQNRLERQNRELLALHRAALDIYGDLSLDTVLQKVVDQASQLLEARYGAVSVIDDRGEILEFITSGVDPDERRRIGDPPKGKGLLGVVLKEGHRLRLAERAVDPRSAGVPENHPAMHSLLAVPILCKSPFRGNLYLTEKLGADTFSMADEETLVRFATAVAIAIDNTHVHKQLRSLAVAEERVRIAREMHDGMAQVLAYVNTKAQAAREHLDRGRAGPAAEQLEQLAAAARDVYTEVREGILALRTEVGPEGSFTAGLEDFVRRWQAQSGIETELVADGLPTLEPTVELQLLRIIQESLSNARKHSGARRARVELRYDPPTLVALVEDDGRGFDPDGLKRSEFPRFGLAIMRERAEAIKARLEIDAVPGRGTRVRIEVPVA